MSERDTFVASDDAVKKNRKPNRKERKQISFRVNEGEYLKLQQSAETLNMSVPAFVKNEAPNYEALEYNIEELRRRLDEIWKVLK